MQNALVPPPDRSCRFASETNPIRHSYGQRTEDFTESPCPFRVRAYAHGRSPLISSSESSRRTRSSS